MDNRNRIAKLAEEKYLAAFGIRKPAVDKMLEILESAYMRTHRADGRPPRLNVLDKPAAALGCYHVIYANRRKMSFLSGKASRKRMLLPF
jgi:hypothetical protein